MKLLITNPAKADKFAAIFSNIKRFSENVTVHFEEDSIYIQCLDGSHCCLFECRLFRSWFDTYDHDTGTDIPNIGINTSILQKVLGARQEQQAIALSFTGDADRLDITFTKGEKNFQKEFELPLMTLDEAHMNVQCGETLVDLIMDTKRFNELVSQLQVFNDGLSLSFSDEGIDFVASGGEGKMKAIIALDDVEEYAIGEGCELTQSYSLRYLGLMCNFSKLASNVVMGFSKDMPMFLKYEVGEDSFVRFHLAPKIDE